jgi:hypothetical protein
MTHKPKDNRAGRGQPTGLALLATYFKEQMTATETVRIQGRPTKVCLLELTATTLVKKALELDQRALMDLLLLIKKAEKWRKLQPKRLVIQAHPDDWKL